MFVGAVDKFFTAAPQQPSQPQEFPTVIIAVIGASVGMVVVVVVAGVVRMRQGAETHLPVNIPQKKMIFDGVAMKIHDKAT